MSAEGCIIYIATGALNPSALSGMLPLVGAAEAGSLRSMSYAQEALENAQNPMYILDYPKIKKLF